MVLPEIRLLRETSKEASPSTQTGLPVSRASRATLKLRDRTSTGAFNCSKTSPPTREDKVPYQDKTQAAGGTAALRVQEALRQCDPEDRELIAGIVDNCLRLSRKTR